MKLTLWPKRYFRFCTDIARKFTYKILSHSQIRVKRYKGKIAGKRKKLCMRQVQGHWWTLWLNSVDDGKHTISFNYSFHNEDELQIRKTAYYRVYTYSSQCVVPRDGNIQWPNSDSKSRTPVVKDRMPTCVRGNGKVAYARCRDL